MNEPPIIYIAASEETLKSVRQELIDFRKLFLPLEKEGLCILKEVSFVSLEDIESTFLSYPGRIKIFHFAGHCDGDFMNSERRESEKFSLLKFIEFLGKEEGLEFVFLNCCFSGKPIDRSHRLGIPRIIYTIDKINDEAAWIFSKTFYQNWINGAGFTTAFKKAQGAIDRRANYILNDKHPATNLEKGLESERGFYIEFRKEELSVSSLWKVFPTFPDSISIAELLRKHSGERLKYAFSLPIYWIALMVGIAAFLGYYLLFPQLNSPDQGILNQVTLKGTVVDSSHKGIADVQVRLFEYLDHTNEEGFFEFKRVELYEELDSLPLSFQKDGFRSIKEAVPVNRAGNFFRVKEEIILYPKRVISSGKRRENPNKTNAETKRQQPNKTDTKEQEGSPNAEHESPEKNERQKPKLLIPLFPSPIPDPKIGIGIGEEGNGFDLYFHKSLLEKFPEHSSYLVAIRWIAKHDFGQIRDWIRQEVIGKKNFDPRLHALQLLYIGKRKISIKPSGLIAGKIAEITLEIYCVDLMNGEIIDIYSDTFEKWGNTPNDAINNTMELVWPPLKEFINRNAN